MVRPHDNACLPGKLHLPLWRTLPKCKSVGKSYSSCGVDKGAAVRQEQADTDDI